jgi:hypothetical protein
MMAAERPSHLRRASPRLAVALGIAVVLRASGFARIGGPNNVRWVSTERASVLAAATLVLALYLSDVRARRPVGRPPPACSTAQGCWRRRSRRS